jgi:GIY-YIG catalytic domain
LTFGRHFFNTIKPICNLIKQNQNEFFNKKILLQKSFRQSQNLLGLLQNSVSNIYFKVKECESPGCLTCPVIIEGCSFTNEINTIKINANLDCNSKGVVYILICKCNKIYIGETMNEFRLRINQHHSNARLCKFNTLYISKHLNTCSMNKIIAASFKVMPLFQVNRNLSTICRYWIKQHLIDMFKPELNK